MSYMDDFNHLKIKLKDIHEATNKFGDKPIGKGGFGDVFKGELLLQKGRRVVAFKRLDRKHGQGDVEFWKEITLLSELKHKNLASLLHFCREDGERILVYKYAPRGSLDVYLGDASLTWTQRLHICIGAASGIAYLHDPKKTQHRVLHRDIKSSNILLDDKWTAKVSDFGLSKIGPANQPRSYLVSNIVGTPGYCDPAYFETGILSKECDVYSFGVVLFEVLCGRLCCVYDKETKLVSILVLMWKKRYNENRLDDIIFPDLKEQIDRESLLRFAAIANQCLDRDLKKRPGMVEIVEELKVALHHQENFHQPMPNVAKLPVSYEFMNEFRHLKIQLENIKRATDNFSENNMIGRGGFGTVYKGKLSSQEGQSMVCFKRLDHRFGQGEVEFWKEISVLSNYKHKNLVSLLSFCNEGDERILSYEYASHGSLDRHLTASSLTWTQRLKISLEVAHALSYLHDPVETQAGLLHRDVKSSNILLDEEWTAKLCDFGISKVVSADQLQTYLFSNVVGTPGYCDPLYMEMGFLSKESDIYSFGVVLFEVMCGKLCFSNSNGGKFQFLVNMWRKCYEEKRLDDIIFCDLKEQMDLGSLDTFSTLAYQCVKKAREERPVMADVIKELEIAVEQQEHFEEMMRIENLAISPISKTSQNQLLMRIPKVILAGDGKTKFNQHQVNVAKTPVSHGFMEEFHHLKIRLEDIQSATNNFDKSKLLSRGGFGPVYQGELSVPEGRIMVACKCLDRKFGQGNVEFWKEVMVLSKYKHENMIALVSFFCEGEDMIIVYEYASRGSLDHYLSDTSLTWTQRLKICIGVARALNYFHDPVGTQEGILHRDIKSATILLDEKWTAKLCDFGLSKVVTADQLQTFVISHTVGTPGYCDPMYVETGMLSKESDVYSFGVVLVEVMCGRLCYEYRNGPLSMLVARWKKCYEENRLNEIVFYDLMEQMDSSSLNTFAAVAYQCVQRTREERPMMAKVMKELEIALEQQEHFEDMKRIENLVISPASTIFQNQLLIRIPKGILVGAGKTWLSKHKNGTIWEIVSAIKCISADSLQHECIENSRFSNVLKGVMHNGFTVKVKTQFLSPDIAYTVNLVFKHNAMNQTTHIPFKFKVNTERHYSNSCIPHAREDGWLMIELYQFTSEKKEHEFKIEFLSLFTITSSTIEYFLEGIEFRPIEYAS